MRKILEKNIKDLNGYIEELKEFKGIEKK